MMGRAEVCLPKCLGKQAPHGDLVVSSPTQLKCYGLRGPASAQAAARKGCWLQRCHAAPYGALRHAIMLSQHSAIKAVQLPHHQCTHWGPSAQTGRAYAVLTSVPFVVSLSCCATQRERTAAAGILSPQQNVLCINRREEVTQVYDTPLLDLVFKAATVHRMYNDPQMVSPSHSFPIERVPNKRP